jgi:hypothetical protein
VLPASDGLVSLLPSGGLQRGTTTVVSSEGTGATTLSLELLGGISKGGYWCAAAGLSSLGLLAAEERSIALDRLVLVPALGPAGRWQQVLATLFDTVDAVLFAPSSVVRSSDARRLSARARDRGAVLVVLDHDRRWSEPCDLRCKVTSSRWEGLGVGEGLLSEHSLEVEVSGRGAAVRPRRSRLALSA